MKRLERKHLKENDLAARLESMRDYLEPRSKAVAKLGIVVVVALLAVIALTTWRQQQAARGDRALAEAMIALNAQVVPTGVTGEDGLPAAAQLGATGTFSTEEAKLNAALPKLQAAAEEYPDTDAGIQARYHMAGALAALGRQEEAIAAFDEVANRAGGDTLYGRMARLGKADAQARAGQLDAAIETWKTMAAEEADELPADAIMMDLARAYVRQGNSEEARKAFTEIVDNHAQSPYAPEARAELQNLDG